MTIRHLPFILLTSVSGAAMAAGAPVAVQFPEGEAVDPTGVNANFQELANRIDDSGQDITDLNSFIEEALSTLTDEFFALADEVTDQAAVTSGEIAGLSAQISENEAQDVSRYIELSNRMDTTVDTAQYVQNENIVNRVFIDTRTQTPGSCDRREDSFTIYSDDQLGLQNIVFSNSSDLAECQNLTYYWNFADGLEAFQYTVHGAQDTTVMLHQGWQVLKGTMRFGETWGRYNDRSISINGSAPIAIPTKEYHRTTLIGAEDVSVPGGSFSECLVIDEQVWYDSEHSSRIYYFCEGPGLVRFVNLTTGQDWQLQSYISN